MATGIKWGLSLEPQTFPMSEGLNYFQAQIIYALNGRCIDL